MFSIDLFLVTKALAAGRVQWPTNGNQKCFSIWSSQNVIWGPKKTKAVLVAFEITKVLFASRFRKKKTTFKGSYWYYFSVEDC